MDITSVSKLIQRREELVDMGRGMGTEGGNKSVLL